MTMIPTFLGIGAQRCGTTWAYRTLAEHPDVFVTSPKELRYFTLNYDKGQNWYEDHFSAAGAAGARGEITPGYIYRPTALERIAADLPDVRLFAMLRNPIDRAFSAYRFFQHRDYAGMTFPEALDADKDLLEQGLYAESLERLWSLFPKDRCLVLLFDDLRASPATIARRLYTFLGVDPEFEPPGVLERVNNPVLPRVQSMLARLHLSGATQVVKNSPVGPPIRAWLARGRKSPPLPVADKTALRNYYSDDVNQVGRMLGRDLGHWLD